jgi:hypothetical protein
MRATGNENDHYFDYRTPLRQQQQHSHTINQEEFMTALIMFNGCNQPPGSR